MSAATCDCLRFHTDECVAHSLGLSVSELRIKCRPSEKGWPHIKTAKNVWRFTDEQVAQIAAMSSSTGVVASADTGQTKKSQRRSA